MVVCPPMNLPTNTFLNRDMKDPHLPFLDLIQRIHLSQFYSLSKPTTISVFCAYQPIVHAPTMEANTE
jgi:hypothetical protein